MVVAGVVVGVVVVVVGVVCVVVVVVGVVLFGACANNGYQALFFSPHLIREA